MAFLRKVSDRRSLARAGRIGPTRKKIRTERVFLSLAGAPRRYLALYETVSLDVFRGEAYRQAFAQQTEWS
ncbi:hypothetical protein PPH41_45515, partial [Burkholderia gladioli]|nr:hypothetical protein [Burkholderia gladioli]